MTTPLTPAEAAAFRVYMEGVDAACAAIMAEEPVPCPVKGCIVEGLNDPTERREHVEQAHPGYCEGCGEYGPFFAGYSCGDCYGGR